MVNAMNTYTAISHNARFYANLGITIGINVTAIFVFTIIEALSKLYTTSQSITIIVGTLIGF